MIRISEKSTEFTMEWYRCYVKKYGSDKVYLSQDENKTTYIVVETDDENRSYGVSYESSGLESLSKSERDSIPF